jgi:hypothetical protein
MSKKMLLAAAAITAASVGYAHADTTYTRHLVCQPITFDNGRDPIIRTDIVMETTWRSNGTVSGMNWSVAHHSQHGATFYREQQYTNWRWNAWPSRAVFQWTGHLDGNYPVFMTGELDDSGNHAWSHYNEYIQNMDHPWERTQTVSRSACHDEPLEESRNFTPPPDEERRPDTPQTGTSVTVTEGLHLRQRPSANSIDLLGGEEIAAGTTFNFPDLDGSCRPANNGYLWCSVRYHLNGYTVEGWVSAYYLQLSDGTRVACYLRPHSEQCADTVRSDQGSNVQTTQPYSPPTSSVSPPTMNDAPAWVSRPSNRR